ncbi:alpha/beta hydrolase [Sphingomonas sp. PAMC 26621]|uniref:alpha/beta hydrolase n=1 Tax=Sphingomonas sp. PAMC 26621 TaxID=1112213 RepID=UPI000287DD9B|nr:alpha/beta hydrolase [Sphingomonas sp. PAMC 26621]
MRRWLLGTALAFGLLVALIAVFVSPPGILSLIDALAGGGIGVERPGNAIAFGSHGQTLDVWRPADAGDAKRPVVIFWYGGGWVKGDRAAYAFAARAFARAGFVVVVPDYRKVPAIRFPAMLQDGAKAVRWTRDHVAAFGGDPARIALSGHSAGAYTVAMLALDRRWLQAEGVDPRIVRAAVPLCGPYDFYPWTSSRAREAFKGVADPRMTQPITFARGDAPPMLLITGTADTTVRPRNALRLAAALHAHGAVVTVKNYPGQTHEAIVMALSRPFRARSSVLADSVAFLDTALGDR